MGMDLIAAKALVSKLGPNLGAPTEVTSAACPAVGRRMEAATEPASRRGRGVLWVLLALMTVVGWYVLVLVAAAGDGYGPPVSLGTTVRQEDVVAVVALREQLPEAPPASLPVHVETTPGGAVPNAGFASRGKGAVNTLFPFYTLTSCSSPARHR